MNRRSFIGAACVMCTVAGISALLQACSAHRYISDYTVGENKLTVKKSSFIIVKKERSVQQKFILLKPERFPFPIVVYRLNENEYKAVLLQCTHQGCELTAYESMMVCPCHGAEFNTKGEVIQGPADTNLRSFNTSQDDENIYIHF